MYQISRYFFLPLVFLLSLLSCSDEEKNDSPRQSLATLAKNPPNIPPQPQRHCLPLPKGWPNPWPCAGTPIEAADSTVLTDALNKARTAKGLKPLVEDKKMACAANLHVQDIASRGVCSHSGSDFSFFVERLKKCGFEFEGGAEVVACGHKDAKEAVLELSRSLEHRIIIFDTNLERVGTAFTSNYWVAIFAVK